MRKEDIGEEIKEITWNLCKKYYLETKEKVDKVRLQNFVSWELEKEFGEVAENAFRIEWMKEVDLFCEKY